MENVDKMLEEMGHIHRGGNSKNQEECQNANTLNERKNAVDDLFGRLDMDGERISELEDMTTETLNTEKQREKIGENGIEYPRIVRQLLRCDKCVR